MVGKFGFGWSAFQFFSLSAFLSRLAARFMQRKSAQERCAASPNSALGFVGKPAWLVVKKQKGTPRRFFGLHPPGWGGLLVRATMGAVRGLQVLGVMGVLDALVSIYIVTLVPQSRLHRLFAGLRRKTRRGRCISIASPGRAPSCDRSAAKLEARPDVR
jgi:hypothetical protein